MEEKKTMEENKNKTDDIEALLKAVLANSTARCAYAENKLRRQIRRELTDDLCFDGTDQDGYIFVRNSDNVFRVELMDKKQLKLLFGEEVGSELYLSSIVKMADALGLKVNISFSKEPVV